MNADMISLHTKTHNINARKENTWVYRYYVVDWFSKLYKGVGGEEATPLFVLLVQYPKPTHGVAVVCVFLPVSSSQVSHHHCTSTLCFLLNHVFAEPLHLPKRAELRTS